MSDSDSLEWLDSTAMLMMGKVLWSTPSSSKSISRPPPMHCIALHCKQNICTCRLRSCVQQASCKTECLPPPPNLHGTKNSHTFLYITTPNHWKKCLYNKKERGPLPCVRWFSFSPHFTQKVSFSKFCGKSGKEAFEKVGRSVSQIENKGESMSLLGNVII